MKGMICITEVTSLNRAGYGEPPRIKKTYRDIFINPLLYEFIEEGSESGFIRYDASPGEQVRKCTETLKTIHYKIEGALK